MTTLKNIIVVVGVVSLGFIVFTLWASFQILSYLFYLITGRFDELEVIVVVPVVLRTAVPQETASEVNWVRDGF